MARREERYVHRHRPTSLAMLDPGRFFRTSVVGSHEVLCCRQSARAWGGLPPAGSRANLAVGRPDPGGATVVALKPKAGPTIGECNS